MHDAGNCPGDVETTCGSPEMRNEIENKVSFRASSEGVSSNNAKNSDSDGNVSDFVQETNENSDDSITENNEDDVYGDVGKYQYEKRFMDLSHIPSLSRNQDPYDIAYNNVSKGFNYMNNDVNDNSTHLQCYNVDSVAYQNDSKNREYKMRSDDNSKILQKRELIQPNGAMQANLDHISVFDGSKNNMNFKQVNTNEPNVYILNQVPGKQNGEHEQDPQFQRHYANSYSVYESG